MNDVITSHIALAKKTYARIEVTKLDDLDKSNLETVMENIKGAMETYELSYKATAKGMYFTKKGLDLEFNNPESVKLTDISSAGKKDIQRHYDASNSCHELLGLILLNERKMIDTVNIASQCVFVTRIIELKQKKQ
jgi:hypothetical protein